MKIQFSRFTIILLSVFALNSCNYAPNSMSEWDKTDLLFEYSGTDDWQAKWMLDGQRSTVIHNEKGMELIAGPEARNDTCHTVIWTKQSFEGNIGIEYDYTRTDTAKQFVNILYFLATGKGTDEYPTDIALWNEKRIVPHMRTYFNHMNTYHISYAALMEGDTNDYIRLRRYNPGNVGLKGTDIPEDYFQTGLFKTNVTYHIQVFKFQNQIEMHIQNKEDESEKLICKWDITGYLPCESGRIGFRHMYTRSARYKDMKVWRLE